MGVLTVMVFAGRLVELSYPYQSSTRKIVTVCVLVAVIGAFVIPRGRLATRATVRAWSAALLAVSLVFGALGVGAVRPGLQSMACGGIGPAFELASFGMFIEAPLVTLALVALFVTRRGRTS